MRKFIQTTLLLLIVIGIGYSQDISADIKKELELLKNSDENLNHRLDVLQKMLDDVIWYQRVGDLAFIDKVYIASVPLWKEKNLTAQGAGNPVKFWSYVFIPIDIDHAKKYPLIVFPHGGVHGDFSTYYTHIIKELMTQQYIVVAAEYRGSTGYGKGHYEKLITAVWRSKMSMPAEII